MFIFHFKMESKRSHSILLFLGTHFYTNCLQICEVCFICPPPPTSPNLKLIPTSPDSRCPVGSSLHQSFIRRGLPHLRGWTGRSSAIREMLESRAGEKLLYRLELGLTTLYLPFTPIFMRLTRLYPPCRQTSQKWSPIPAQPMIIIFFIYRLYCQTSIHLLPLIRGRVAGAAA